MGKLDVLITVAAAVGRNVIRHNFLVPVFLHSGEKSRKPCAFVVSPSGVYFDAVTIRLHMYCWVHIRTGCFSKMMFRAVDPEYNCTRN